MRVARTDPSLAYRLAIRVEENRYSSAWIGPVCGLASAVLYTLANIALRQCVDVDAYLVSAVKAVPTVILLGPLIAMQYARGSSQNSNVIGGSDRKGSQRSARFRFPRFIAASFLAQFVGNVAFQKALEHIGLAASVPITLGALIVGGAVLGAALLGEPVGRQKVFAMITLIAAVIVLSLPHAEEASAPTKPADVSIEQSESPPQPLSIVIGSLWAALSGFTYSFFGVTLRQTLQCGVRSTLLMFLSGLTGTITLWSFCLLVLGVETISSTQTSQWLFMAAAGIFNFSAFIAITASLRLLPVVAVNLINASQVAMAAVAGVVLFSEPVTVQLAVGIALTIVGLLILARRTRASVLVTD